MSAILIIGNTTSDAHVLRLQTALVARGHTVTLSTVAAFNASPSTVASGQDAMVVATYDFDDSSALATALIGEINSTRGCVVGRALQQASLWNDGDLSPDTVACRLGIIDVERAHASGTGVGTKWAVADAESIVGSAFEPSFFINMARADGAALQRSSHVPDDGIHVIRKAGTVNLYGNSGMAACVTTPPSTTLVGHRNGSTEDGRMAWIGHHWLDVDAWGAGGASAWVQLAEWAAGPVDDEYPTAGTHVSVLKGYLFLGFGNLSSSLTSWVQNLAGGSITVEGRIDTGTYQTLTNGAAFPGGLIGVGTSLNNKILTVRITMTSASSAATPDLSALAIQVNGATIPLIASPTDFYEDGVLDFTSGNLATFPAKEVKSYDPATRNIVFYEPLRRTVVAEDTFTIYAGCKKRFTEDCVTKFANGINYQGEPHLPGADALYKIEDAS